MDEELGRHNVESLAHFLADARHRSTAVRRGAVGALGLMTVFDATQVFRQLLTAWSPRRGLRLGVDSGLSGFASQLFQLRTQARLVLGDRLLEQASLLGVHRLGAGAELPALQASQLEGDLLDLGIAPGDVAVLALQEIPGLV